jgi:hypothetical protein
MKKVEVPWFDQRSGSSFSVELSQWCEGQGLINGVDYKWHFVPDQKVSVFYFDDSRESYATLFALRWLGANN